MQNILIYGNSGVGKTKLADTLGFVYLKSGILLRDKFRHVTKMEFTSSYVNESAKMTRELLYSTLEGVLFIDEAYELGPNTSMFGKGLDHGGEAITEMVNFIDKNVGLGVIIAAGYEKDMEQRFIGSNQGMARRFPHKFILPNYDARALTDILMRFLEKAVDGTVSLTDQDASVAYTLITKILKRYPDIFPRQAGDMLVLSDCITKKIYASVGRDWVNGNTQNNSFFITAGINNYLQREDISVAYKNA